MPCCVVREKNKKKMSRALWKTEPPQRECTTACGRNLQIERALYRIIQSSEYATAYPLWAARAGAAAPDSAASCNSTRKREPEIADTAVCREFSIQRCVHATSTEKTRATVPGTAVSSNSSRTHRTTNSERRTQQL